MHLEQSPLNDTVLRWYFWVGIMFIISVHLWPAIQQTLNAIINMILIPMFRLHANCRYSSNSKGLFCLFCRLHPRKLRDQPRHYGTLSIFLLTPRLANGRRCLIFYGLDFDLEERKHVLAIHVNPQKETEHEVQIKKYRKRTTTNLSQCHGWWWLSNTILRGSALMLLSST